MTDIKVSELLAARVDLELEILHAVMGAVEKFKNRTNFTPYRIDVQLQSITSIGCPRLYVPVDVTADFDFSDIQTNR